MTTATWVTLILICGFVWGGFAYTVLRALRAESTKADAP